MVEKWEELLNRPPKLPKALSPLARGKVPVVPLKVTATVEPSPATGRRAVDVESVSINPDEPIPEDYIRAEDQ